MSEEEELGAKKIRLDLKKIEKLASKGLTQEQIAYSLGISPMTLSRRKQEEPELEEALARGKAKGIEEVANALFDNALGGNAASQIFYLKARSPENWKDTGRVEITGANGGPLQSISLTNEEFAAIAKSLSEEI